MEPRLPPNQAQSLVEWSEAGETGCTNAATWAQNINFVVGGFVWLKKPPTRNHSSEVLI